MSTNLQITLKTLKNVTKNGKFNATGLLAQNTEKKACAAYNGKRENIHLTSKQHYPQMAILPLPPNIDPTETTRFSPQRTRDINSNGILSYGATFNQIDITVDNSSADPRVDSYDCTGAVSLNSSMQSNVPSPFGSMNKFTHLNMPGGQWEQGNKFMSHSLQSSHYMNLRQSVRSNWSNYELSSEDKGILKKMLPTHNQDIYITRNRNTITQACLSFCNNTTLNVRFYSTKTQPQKEVNTYDSIPNSDTIKMSRVDKLKKAVKEYGSTVIIFHVGISLVSLGTFYLLVSSGLDFVAIIEYFGWKTSALTTKLTAGASTFVVAYAVHKLIAPVRISITLAATPFIVRYLRLKGVLKPPS